jgi:hypothetical protein
VGYSGCTVGSVDKSTWDIFGPVQVSVHGACGGRSAPCEARLDAVATRTTERRGCDVRRTRRPLAQKWQNGGAGMRRASAMQRCLSDSNTEPGLMLRVRNSSDGNVGSPRARISQLMRGGLERSCKRAAHFRASLETGHYHWQVRGHRCTLTAPSRGAVGRGSDQRHLGRSGQPRAGAPAPTLLLVAAARRGCRDPAVCPSACSSIRTPERALKHAEAQWGPGAKSTRRSGTLGPATVPPSTQCPSVNCSE